MKRKIFLALLIGILLTGCSLKQEEKAISITYGEMKTMERISELSFKVDLEHEKVEEMDNSQKNNIARQLSDKSFTELSGSEMINLFKKFYGEDKTLTFENIKCHMNHENEKEQVLYYFDKEHDKYVYNEDHPGHGGGGITFIGTKMEYDSLEIEKDLYKYNVKILFYGDALCHDIGPCEYGDGYKSYKDALNKTNKLVSIEGNDKYWTTYYDGFPELKMDELYNDYKQDLDTYQFIFKKVDNNLVFIEYKKI